MPTISSLTKEIINKNTLLKESLTLGIASHAKLAEYIKPQLEKKTGKTINLHTIIMALRRYEEGLKLNQTSEGNSYFKEINIKTDISYLLLKESKSSIDVIEKFYKKIEDEQSQIYHIIRDQNEIGLITNNQIMKQILETIDKKNIIKLFINLVIMTLKYTDEYRNSPEILHNISWQLSREDVKIVAWIHKSNELLILLNEKDVIPSYNALFKFKKTIEITPSQDNKKNIRITPQK